ncbi:MAG: TadE family protein [Myxococcota bacterium]
MDVFRRRGANALEFGLTVPIFMMLMLGIVDYGWIYVHHAGLANAAYLGCREGSMIDPNSPNATTGGPVQTAEETIENHAAYFCANATCDVVVEDIDDPPQRSLQCTISIDPYQPLIGFLPPGLLPDVLVSTAQQRLEWQRAR